MTSPPSIDALASRFAAPGVTIDLGEGGMPRVRIRTSLCSGEIYLHGAHITAYRPADQEPVLWVSSNSAFAPGKAIRGGVPICFPWFGPHPRHPDWQIHGFARTHDWELVDVGPQPTGEVNVILRLVSRPEFGAFGYERVETYFAVLFGATLEMGLLVRNLGPRPFWFEAALHSYFVVGDIHQVTVSGLGGASYVDKLRRNQSFTETRDAIRFTEETDRVYSSGATCVLHDPTMRRRIINEKLGSMSTVIWNPWPRKAAEIGLAEGEWERYACVETAAAMENAVTLAPGATHSLGANIRVENE